jgi:hypothetical protein
MKDRVNFRLYLLSYFFLSGHQPRTFYHYKELFTNIMSDQETRVNNYNDTAILWFPKVFHCIEKHMGVGGTMEKADVYCTNQMASWVEGFFIVDLFCLWLLGFFWILDLVGTTGYLFIFPLYRVKKTKKNIHCYTFQELSMSKKLFAILLAQNLEPLFWQDVVRSILTTRKNIGQQRYAVKTKNVTENTVDKCEQGYQMKNKAQQQGGNKHTTVVQIEQTDNSDNTDNTDNSDLEMDEIRSLKLD